MKKNNLSEGIMAIVFVLLLFITNAIYLYFDEGISAFQAIHTVMQEIANWLKYMALGLFIVAFVLLFVLLLNKFFRKKRKTKKNDVNHSL